MPKTKDMADDDFERDTENTESKLRESKTGKETSSCCVVKTEEDETEAEPPMVVSPKNRRKIRQPKQYKPKSPEDQEPNGIGGNSEDTQGSLSNGPSSPVDPTERPGSSSSLENEAHVMTASQEPKQVESSPLEKRKPASQKSTQAPHKSTSASQKPTPVSQKPSPTSQKPKRSGARKAKHQNPTVPKKPEDLIREALLSGQSSSQATKRDAQYRKSYAYKIWKERANCEVTSSGSTEQQAALGPGTKQGAGSLVSVNQQKQERVTYYWPPKQYVNEQPGFYTNGKYYEMNPQVSYGVQSVPQIPHTTSTVPPINHTNSVATTARVTSLTSVVHTSSPGVVSSGVEATVSSRPSQDATYHHRGEYVFEKGPVNRNIIKPGPSNVVVVQQYPHNNRVSPPVPNSTSGPAAVNSSHPQRFPATNHQPPVTAPNNPQPAIATQSPSPETLPSAMPRKEPTEPKVNGVAKSPSNLVSLVKSSLKRKHCKENVQPVSFKSKLKSKRKLETDKAESGPAKKSAKPTIFTPLNEQEAEKLANDIYDVNLEYFPFQTLAEKAAKTKTDETVQTETKTRVREIEKVRCLLKDFYDVTYSCTEDPDMQKFDSASRKFGRKNILNHLSLLDRYFAELQKKVDCSS